MDRLCENCRDVPNLFTAISIWFTSALWRALMLAAIILVTLVDVMRRLPA